MSNFLIALVVNALLILALAPHRRLPKGPMHSGDSEDDSTRDYDYLPTPGDINIVRSMMSSAKSLPPDVVDMIFDHAEYWAHSMNEIDFKEEHKVPLRVVGGSRMEDKFLLRSFPVGLVTVDGRVSLAETLAYDTNEAKPRPLSREHDLRFFASLAEYPTPRLVHPVRKIVFSIKSRDQGRGGTRRLVGTYESTWTWFEAGLERFDADQECEPHCVGDLRYESSKSKAPSLPMCALRSLQPQLATGLDDRGQQRYDHPLHPNEKYTIQRNKMATPQWYENIVTWSWLDQPRSEVGEQELADVGRGRETGDGTFVRSLKMGDVVTVWAKARFPAWVNMVEKVRIEVYWAV